MENLVIEVNALKTQLNVVMDRQEEMTKILAENNVLLRRNLGLFDVTQTLFPIDTEEKLKKMENDLNSEQRADMVGAIKRIMNGNIRNISRILNKNIIMAYNYDGTKNKKSLKIFGNVLNALFEATKKEGTTYEDFVKELRASFRRIKNTTNKENSRFESRI